MNVAIGLDTSCYTTSVAAVDACGRVRAFQRLLLPVESGQRGLRQSEAVFAHVRQMPGLVEALARELGPAKVVATAASIAPREAADSYMPVFTVGEGHARALAATWQVPFYGVSHQQGHITAGQLNQPPMDARFVALHLSGGTTDLLLSEQERLTPLGSSLDLHAGQLIDRIGVALGLPFPAGPALEALACAATQPARGALPASLANGDLDCHLSGAETQAMQWIRNQTLLPEVLALEVYDLLARTVARMLKAACTQTGVRQALVVGGVASSALLRSLIRQRLRKLGAEMDLRFGEPQYSADNAAGVAWLGMRRYLELSATGADTQPTGASQTE